MKKYVEIKIFVLMPSEKDKVLELNQYVKSDKMTCIIYADIESLIRKIDGCANNLEDPSTKKICEHIPCGYSMATIWTFDHVESSHTLYPRKDCMKKLCESLTEDAKDILEFEKEKVTVNKRGIKIISGCKGMLFSWEENLKKAL